MSQSKPRALILRPMQPDDLPSVLEIQRACYIPVMNEDGPTLRGRLAAAPDFSWVGEQAGQVCTYLVTYPSLLGEITPLGGDFALPEKPDCLYFHDLAVHPGMAGTGCGAALVAHALQAGRQQGLMQAALVCVQDALAFWRGRGFIERGLPDGPAQTALASYPGKACYMTRLPG